MLNAEPVPEALCKITFFKRCYRPTSSTLAAIAAEVGHIDAVMTGISGMDATTTAQLQEVADLFPSTPLLQFKNIFGESYSAYGLGIYATAHILHQQRFPEEMLILGYNRPVSLQRILVLNQIGGKDYTFTVLEKL